MKWWIILLGILLILVLLGRPVTGRDVLITNVTGPPTLSQTAESVSRAARIARAFWGGTRCLHISYHYRALRSNVIAQAQWYTLSLTPDTYLHCSITFDTAKIRVSFALYCGAVVHEWGHLAGRGHAQNPRNIMFPRLTKDNIPVVCQ